MGADSRAFAVSYASFKCYVVPAFGTHRTPRKPTSPPAPMHLLSRHPEIAVTVAFVLGQLTILAPMLLLRLLDRTPILPNEPHRRAT